MRRQNPPEASLDQACAIERYLNPTAIAAAYTLFASLSFTFIALLFAMLVYDYILIPTAGTITVFVVIALAPGAVALLAFKQKPNDVVSVCIRSLADSKRRPVEVAPDPHAFKVLLMSGETLCVNFGFYYPASYHTTEIKERLNVFVRAALQGECTKRAELPTDREIEDAIDDALEVVAAEFGIPVLYPELRDMHKIRDAYSKQLDLTSSEFLGTGTLG